MELDKIKAVFNRCSIDELRELQDCVNSLITKIETTMSISNHVGARDLRTESRFELRTNGFLRRLTNLKSGQKTDYSVTIKDISRSGMCLIVNPGFIYSNAAEVTFQGPNGKMKQCLLEIVRMKRNVIDGQPVLELGCRSINQEQLQHYLTQDRRIDELQSRMKNRENIPVFLVTQQLTETKDISARIETVGHPVTTVQTVHEVIELAKQDKDVLTILLDCENLCQDAEQMTALIDIPQKMATLAIIQDEIQRFDLFKVGIDECILEDHVEPFLYRTMDRALVGNAVRKGHRIIQTQSDVLVFATSSTIINMIEFHLEECQLQSKAISDFTELEKINVKSIALAFVEFDPNNTDLFDKLRKMLAAIPVVAICDKLGNGTIAMAHDATEYVTMPVNTDQIQNTLKCVSPKLLEEHAANAQPSNIS